MEREQRIRELWEEHTYKEMSNILGTSQAVIGKMAKNLGLTKRKPSFLPTASQNQIIYGCLLGGRKY